MFDKQKYFNELYENNSKNIPTCAFLFRDFGVEGGCKYFVETGTHLGHGVQYALDWGFENILSCEFMSSRYEECLERFSDNDNVSLFLGDSRDCISEMVKSVDSKACFWLDAHSEGGGVPTFEELDEIKKHSIKNHVIIIDDIPEYFSGNNRVKLEQKILEINENYSFVYFPVWMGNAPDYKTHRLAEDYQLVAYVDE